MERTEKETTYQETRRVQKGDFAAAGQISASYKNMLKRLGVDSKVVRRLAIASYEAEINLAIHTLGGSMTIIVYPDHIFLVVEDTGPGIADIALAMQEGYSTAPEEVRMLGFGAGMGLPNMKKYSDDMKIETELGVGTTVTMTVRIC